MFVLKLIYAPLYIIENWKYKIFTACSALTIILLHEQVFTLKFAYFSDL